MVQLDAIWRGLSTKGYAPYPLIGTFVELLCYVYADSRFYPVVRICKAFLVVFN